MILLDTNVLSEQFRVSPSQAVVDWLNNQPLETLYLSSMTLAEIRAGIAIMPVGKKQKTLSESVENELFPLFAGRILAFDAEGSKTYAQVLRNTKLAGSGIETADAVIAAIALSNGLSIATRDESPFIAAGLKVINPWNYQ